MKLSTPPHTLLALVCSFSCLSLSSAFAGPKHAHKKGHKHRANKVEKKAERSAAIEEKRVGDSDRTPRLNQEQEQLERRVAAAEKAGRLSQGEAASLRRKLESLGRYEKTLKSGDLSTHERERLHQKAIEIRRDLHKEIKD